MLKIVYHPAYLKYNFGLGHPFWPERAEVFLDKIDLCLRSGIVLCLRSGIVSIVEPKKATDEEILLVHTKEYLERVKELAARGGSLSVDTPLNKNVLEAAYYSVGGSILALNLAMEGEVAVNLLGGLHHAGIADSSGFCLFNDHAIAIRKLQKEGKIEKAMVIDLDVHAGQGTQEIFYDDPTVFTISLHQDPRTLYPGTGFVHQRGERKGEGFNLNVPLAPGTGEKEYLEALDKVLPNYDKFKPDLLVVVLGADTYKEDPLANFNLELETYKKIGRRFVDKRPLAVMFAGGYSQATPKIWLKFLTPFTS